MAQFSRIEVVQQMKESGMVSLFYHPDIEVAKSVLKQMVAAVRISRSADQPVCLANAADRLRASI